MSTDKWMDKEEVVHIYSEILLSHKKEWTNAICCNRNGPRDDPTKWPKLEHNKYMMSLLCEI